MPNRPPAQPAQWKQGISRRIGYYMLGISIGLILLGFMYMARQNESRRREAAKQTPQVAPPTAP